MHDVLRARLIRKIESLPEAQVYQVLDYIEFLESKYAEDLQKQASGLQRLAEGIEDRLRKRAFNPSNLREVFQVVAAADRALNSVAQAGKQLLGDFGDDAPPPRAGEVGEPRKESEDGDGTGPPGPSEQKTEPGGG